MTPLENYFKFLTIIERLKYTDRFSAASLEFKESTAAHTWRVAIMAFTLGEELALDIDLFKAVKIALVHDIVECIHGDVDYTLVVKGKISKTEKHAQEAAAIKIICAPLDPALSAELTALWEEYEHVSSAEAKYIKALEKIECIAHALDVGVALHHMPEVFPVYADPHVKNFPALLPVLQEAKLRLKKEFTSADIPWKDEYNYGL